MSEYDLDNPAINFDDSGHMETTDTVQHDDEKPGFNLHAEIELALGPLLDRMDRAYRHSCRKEQARLAALPRRTTIPAASPSASTATWKVLNFGGPPTGRQWHIRAAAASNLTEGLAGAFSEIMLFIGAPATLEMIDPANGPSGGALMAGRDNLLTGPSEAGIASSKYSVGQMYVPAGEIAYLVAKPLTVSDMVQGLLTIEDEPLAAITNITAWE